MPMTKQILEEYSSRHTAYGRRDYPDLKLDGNPDSLPPHWAWRKRYMTPDEFDTWELNGLMAHDKLTRGGV